MGVLRGKLTRVGRRRRLTGVGAALLFLAATAVPLVGLQQAGSAATPLSISVSGNQLVNGSGQPVVLRGVNLSGTEFVCIQGGTPTSRGTGIYGGPADQASTYQAMAAWHVNVVRVPLNEDCWLGINGVNPAYGGLNYQKAIEAEVAAINQAGMYAILDLHWTSPGPYAAMTQQPMADTDHSIAFWQSVASTFKANPAVIFDLFNEPFFYGSYLANPNENPWQCWLNGCAMTQFISAGQTLPDGTTTGYTTTYSWQSAGMQQLIDAVRGTGATQPVLVNGVGWGGDDSGWLANAPTDPAHQLIAGAHMYPCSNCGPISTSAWDSVFDPIGQQYPILFGETGDSSAGPETFLPTFLPWADAHSWGYLAWTWNPWSNPDFVLIQNWNGTPTTGEGAYYQAHLALVAPTQPTGGSSSTTTSTTTTSTTTTTAPTSSTTTTTTAPTSTTNTTTTAPPSTTTSSGGSSSTPTQVGAATTFASASSSSPHTALPSGTAAGDVLVTDIETSGNGVTISCPTGWTKVLSVANWTDMVVCETVAVSGQSAPTATLSVAGQTSMVTVAFSGVNTTAPVDAAASATSSTSPSVSTSSAGDLLLFFEGDSGWNVTPTAPSGSTLAATVNDVQASQVAVATEADLSSGVSAPATWAPSGATTVTVALAP